MSPEVGDVGEDLVEVVEGTGGDGDGWGGWAGALLLKLTPIGGVETDAKLLSCCLAG